MPKQTAAQPVGAQTPKVDATARNAATALTISPLPRALQDVLTLQRQIGNLATQRLLQGQVQRVVITDPDQLKTARMKHQAAQLNNAKDKSALLNAIEEGLKNRSTDRRLANSSEWVKAGKAKLYAQTTTGDSDERIAAAGMTPADDMALFPNGLAGNDDHIYGSIKPSYKYDDLDNNTGVDLDEDGQVTNGWNVPGAIAIYNARNVPMESVWQTLRHEVQHDADHSDDKTTAAGTDKMEQRFEAYKTEYRAYNYQQTGYEHLSVTKDVSKYGYTWKERQLAIFEHIWGGYSHTKKFWDNSGVDSQPSSKGSPYDNTLGTPEKTAIEARQTRLVAYVNPDVEGYNKWNSVRVENFYQALKAVPNGTSDAADPTIVTLLERCKPLKLEDMRYIRAESPDFERMLTAKLAGAAKTAVYAKLGKK